MTMLTRTAIAKITSLTALFMPLVVLAEDVTVPILLGKIRGILDALIPFIIGLAVFVILWGIFTYITRAAEEEKRAEARSYIVWGVVGVFFMVSIWGFVVILVNTFGVGSTIDASQIPTVPEFTPAP